MVSRPGLVSGRGRRIPALERRHIVEITRIFTWSTGRPGVQYGSISAWRARALPRLGRAQWPTRRAGCAPPRFARASDAPTAPLLRRARSREHGLRHRIVLAT